MLHPIESFQRQSEFGRRLPASNPSLFSLQYKSDSIEDQDANNAVSPRRITQSKSSQSKSQSAKKSTSPKQTDSLRTSDGSARYFDLETIKDSVDIVSVVESFDLDRFERKSLNRATAICPFHDDHNPSLSIDGQRGLYKCFSCGAGGDVFGFVRAMHKVQSGEELSFVDSVKFIQNEFGAANASTSVKRPTAGTNRPKIETKEMIQKKKRIHFANALAAAYYVEFLTHPTAGGARQYLTDTRFFPPSAIRRFSIGYAPDCYFGVQRRKNGWGKSGLVEYLRQQNFTAQECVDAGLAVVIQSKQSRTSASNDDPSNKDDEITFESIMDRFRGRIVVPILDASGKNIVAFGGRTLPGFADEANQRYEGPKYLNSPETLAFHKQEILFGHHLAETDKFRSLLLVEGYLDVVSLASVGVSNVVASMGTAISSDQLELAAQSSERVVICMDNDSAGKMAVERLCRDGKLAGVARMFPSTQFCVADLPEGSKDPAELVESFLPGKEIEAKEMVHAELIQKAEPWTHWFVRSIIGSLDGLPVDDKDSATNGIFHELAGLISENKQDQQELAHLAATSLASAMAPESVESLGPSLEIDLLDLASRMQNTRNLTNNGESLGTIHKGRVQGISESDKLARRKPSTSSSLDPQASENKISRSGRVLDISEDEKLSSQSKRESSSGPFSAVSQWSLHDDDSHHENFQAPIPLASFEDAGKMAKVGKQRRKAKMKRRSKHSFDPKLTPHFAGFQFRQKADLDWLQTTDGGKGRSGLDGTHVPVVPPSNSIKGRYQPRPRRPVYFNSNEFHGSQFITQDAVEAGYSPKHVQTRDASVFQKGVSSLLRPNTASITTDSENALLRQLILNPAARSFMKNWIQARTVIQSSSSDIKWSCSEKDWLMHCLIQDAGVASIQANEPSLVLQTLLDRDDIPEGVLVEPTNQTDSEGVLNYLFEEMTPSEKTFFPKSSAQVEYHLQDILGGLLWVAAKNELDGIQSDLLNLSHELEQVLPSSNHGIALLNDQGHEVVAKDDSLSNLTNANYRNHEEISQEFHHRVKRMEQLTQRLCSIEEMRRRSSSRALDANNALKVEGRISSTLREKLCSDFEDFVLSMGHTDASWELGPNEEPYETALERMDSRWGEWSEEGYLWSPSDADNVKTPIPDDPLMDDDNEDDEESLAASLERMDRDWAEWL